MSVSGKPFDRRKSAFFARDAVLMSTSSRKRRATSSWSEGSAADAGLSCESPMPQRGGWSHMAEVDIWAA